MLTLLAESYFHTIDPFAIHFTGNFGLRWYGLAYAAGFLIAWLMLRWAAKTGRSPMSVQAAGDAMFYVIGGVLLGGRLGYAIFYDPKLFIGFSDTIPWWDLLAINKGGMSAHGGILGVVGACWLIRKRYGLPFMHQLDLGAIVCTPGLFLGRLANFANAELWGKRIPEAMQADPPWWSVKYPEQVTDRWLPIALDPTGVSLDLVRHCAADFGISAGSDEVLRSLVVDEVGRRLLELEPLRDVVTGQADFYSALVHAAMQGREQVIETMRPLLTAFYPSQIFQAITDGPILFTLLALVWIKPRKPGVVASWFLMGYGSLRITTEVFRQPDVGVSLLLGLSRGQVLSVLMIVGGALMLWWSSRRKVERLGGLRKPVEAAASEPAS
jgi:phosphatidylglycerol:prolipoprotein diacylglycerol transferase